jgi:hypothetical protein
MNRRLHLPLQALATKLEIDSKSFVPLGAAGTPYRRQYRDVSIAAGGVAKSAIALSAAAAQNVVS